MIQTYINDISTETKIVALTCCSCGNVFGIGSFYEQRRREDHRIFYCPNGHGQSYSAQTEAERLAAQLKHARARETALRDQKEATERSLAATKGELTKARKRAAAGVCPCCKRSFVNVTRHVAGKHPEFAAEHGISVAS